MAINAFFKTVSVSAKQEFSGGILPIVKKHLMSIIWFIFMSQIWAMIDATGKSPLSLNQLLTYSLMSTVFRKQMDIITPATSSLWEGSVIGRYTRPMHIFSSFISETIGKWWIPVFLCLSLPLWLLSPLLGINPFPFSLCYGLLSFISLIFSASLGFALDFIFASVAIRMKNACWAATQIRESVLTLLSGALIPFALMPKKIGDFLALLPFASISSSPLGIYTGILHPIKPMIMQIIWNILFWLVAFRLYKKSEEKMISYGG